MRSAVALALLLSAACSSSGGGYAFKPTVDGAGGRVMAEPPCMSPDGGGRRFLCQQGNATGYVECSAYPDGCVDCECVADNRRLGFCTPDPKLVSLCGRGDCCGVTP